MGQDPVGCGRCIEGFIGSTDQLLGGDDAVLEQADNPETRIILDGCLERP
jgi:hypothetical protein